MLNARAWNRRLLNEQDRELADFLILFVLLPIAIPRSIARSLGIFFFSSMWRGLKCDPTKRGYYATSPVQPVDTVLVYQPYSLSGNLWQFFIARRDNVSACSIPSLYTLSKNLCSTPHDRPSKKCTATLCKLPAPWYLHERTSSTVIMFSLFTGLYGTLPEIRWDGITRHHRQRRSLIYWRDCRWEKIRQRSGTRYVYLAWCDQVVICSIGASRHGVLCYSRSYSRCASFRRYTNRKLFETIAILIPKIEREGRMHAICLFPEKNMSGTYIRGHVFKSMYATVTCNKTR